MIGWIKGHTGQQAFKVLTRLFYVALIAGIVTVFLYLTFTGKTRWSGRSMTLLDPTFAQKFLPIVASVSEHQATTWASFFMDLHAILIFFPVGLYFCLKDYSKGKLYIALYGVLAVYFASKEFPIILAY